jgi:hypothetical protein
MWRTRSGRWEGSGKVQGAAVPPQGKRSREWPRWARRRPADFALLLPLILLNLVVMGFEEYHPFLRGFSRWLGLATLLLALYASGVGRTFLLTVGSLALVAAALWRQALVSRGMLGIAVVASFTALVALAPIAILWKVRKEFAKEGVDAEVVLGALCAYLYIGTWFAFTYGIAVLLSNAPFFAQPGAERPLNYLYFSFITLTTTGFGDLSPAYGPGRMLAAVEAVIGQLYLVTVVALVVSAFRTRR